MENNIKYIEIDCAPGGIRPFHCLNEALQGTGISPVEHISAAFGCWMFHFLDVSDEVWYANIDTIKERLINMYHNGKIRYASWFDNRNS